MAVEKTRHPDLEDKIEKKDDGTLFNGQFSISYPYPQDQSGIGYDFVNYKDGKVHGDPGIECIDGVKELWENGKFIKRTAQPFNDSWGLD
jgi:hypothetical protein